MLWTQGQSSEKILTAPVGMQEAGREGLPGASRTNLQEAGQEAKHLGLRVAPALDKCTTSLHGILPDAKVPQ